MNRPGGVPEWFKGAVLKTVVGASLPGVRIPPPPNSNSIKTGLRTGFFLYNIRSQLTLKNMTEENITRRTFLRNCAIAAGASAAISYGSVLYSNFLTVTHHKIDTGKLEKPFKLLHFTDFHSSQELQEKVLKDFIKTVQSIKPDFVCYTGDSISHDKRYIEPLNNIFSKPTAKYAKFACLGNHDFEDKNKGRTIIREVGSAGYEYLINNSEKYEFNGQTIHFFGLDDLWNGKQDFKKTFNNLNKEQLNILLTHNPSNIEEISRYNPDIVLAGHTHGGQIYLPYILNGIYKKLYDPRFIRGLYKVGNSTLYVNRGIGSTLTTMRLLGRRYTIPAIRLFAQPEIAIFEIK